MDDPISTSIARKPDLLAIRILSYEMVEREWWCGGLGIVAPSVVALCASIKLGGRFIGRSCLEHPPERSSILALWAFNTCGWKCLHTVPFHDLERDILGGLDDRFFPALLFNLFSLKAAFRACHFLLFSRNRPQTCLALWAKPQIA
jgi:hypothetical protein